MFRHAISLLTPRFLRFRREVMMLWHAFWRPDTPAYLKVAAVFAVVYLLSPADLLPDIFPVLGWIDDILIVPFIVSWIVSRLPQTAAPTPDFKTGPVIDGTARRR